jgi:uncharacterized protein
MRLRQFGLGLAASALAAVPARGAIVINEIDSDTVNTPATDFAEFIELYSTTGTTTSLAGYTLVLFNGGNGDASADVSYKSIDLDAFSTNASGYFVFGTTSVPQANNTTFLGAGNTLQNGQDAVALYSADATAFPNGTAPTTTNLVDAIVYDTQDADDAPLLAALGQTIEYDENVNGASPPSDSLARVPNGTGQFVAQAPTPGAINVVPEPASIALLSLGGLFLRRRCR